ncbi:MAG: DinB family protein [Sneathiella sp.]
MIDHFQKFALYNQWANSRLYEVTATLTAEEQTRDLGAFFGNILGTLNHILVGDLFWMERIEGTGQKPSSLDEILYKTFSELRIARSASDERLIRITNTQSQEDYNSYLDYMTTKGVACHDHKAEVFAHLFNHQTHHRGQCHHMLTQLGKTLPPLDMIYFFRERE